MLFETKFSQAVQTSIGSQANTRIQVAEAATVLQQQWRKRGCYME